MAISDFVKTNIHGAVTLADGTGVPVTLALLYDMGDVAVTGLSGDRLNEVIKHQRRGKRVSESHGARRYPQITLSGFMTGEGATAPGSMQAFLTKNTPYTANISTNGAGRVYAVNLTLDIEGTDFGDAADWQSVFNDCIPVEMSFGEAEDGNKFSVTLDVCGAITGDIAAAEIA